MKKIISFVIIVLMQIIVLEWPIKNQYLFEWQIDTVTFFIERKLNATINLTIDEFAFILMFFSELALLKNIISKRISDKDIVISLILFFSAYWTLLTRVGWFDGNLFIRSSIPLFVFLLLCLLYWIYEKLKIYINAKHEKY